MPDPEAHVSPFAEFAAKKARAAEAADLPPYETLIDNAPEFAGLIPIGNSWTERYFGGPLYESALTDAAVPAFNLVFVRSRDDNTDASDPSGLGGGATDKHLIYEGLSRATADGVLAGSKTIGDGNLIFSVWHPELVRLRESLGKPRHPIQIVATLLGVLPIETGLIFNVPDIPVVILTIAEPARTLVERTRTRPWITVLSSGEASDLRTHARHLKESVGIDRVSAVGGRTVASALIDSGLIRDLYLTTGAIEGGTPGTPFYTGGRELSPELIVRKRGTREESGVIFEHWRIRADS